MTTRTEIGRLAVRRSIEIDAPPERVWREFESQERMALWFSDAGGYPMFNKRLKYEPRVGGVFETEGMHKDTVHFLFTGRVLVFDPPHELTVEWDAKILGDDQPAPNWPAPSLVSFMLTPAGNKTRVEIVHHGFDRMGVVGPELYEGFEGGWKDGQVIALRNLVETGSATG